MGLAAPKNRMKLSHDPNNTKWTRDTQSFGHKIMASQGWQPGDHLGVQGSAHSELHTDANFSHIRVTIKDDNLGLGAKIGSGVGPGECTGLDAFQNLLGRLNGRDEDEMEKEQKSREELKRAVYAEQKWGTIRFVKGGLLIGDKIQTLIDDEKERVRKLNGVESSSDSDSSEEESEEEEEQSTVTEKTSNKRKLEEIEEVVPEVVAIKVKKSKKRKVEEDEGVKVVKVRKSKKTRAESSSASENEVTEALKDVKLSKKQKKSKQSTSADADSNTTEDEEARRIRKQAKKQQKEEKKARKEQSRAAAAESSKDSKSKSKKDKKEKKEKKDKDRSGSKDSSKLTMKESTPVVGSGASTPVMGGRHAVRARNIAQKRLAAMDVASLNQIFMIKS